MLIHEYQAKRILKNYGINVPRGDIATNSIQAKEIAEQLETRFVILKSQIHSSGRSKSGGIKAVKSLDDVRIYSEQMLNSNLITTYTGEEGRKVEKIYIEEGCHVKHEFYLALMVDSSKNRINLITSTEGGVNIEENASISPDKIIELPISIRKGIDKHKLHEIATSLGLNKNQYNQFASIITKLYRAFTELDCTLIEINPLALDDKDKFIILDANMQFDDNALFKHPEISILRDRNQESSIKKTSNPLGLNYIKLKGEIGCIVNGTGLAMATMDTIKQQGASPANFLNIGSEVSRQKLSEALKIMMPDKDIKTIFINIFGDITPCDLIAQNIIDAYAETHSETPLVVRLEGANALEARELMANCHHNITIKDSLIGATQQAIALVNTIGTENYITRVVA